MTHATIILWVALGALCWPAFVYVTARIAARRAQRRAERAAWERQERDERRWRRLMRDMWRAPVKPSPIAIRFHALTDVCAVERLLSRLAHVERT